MLGHMGWPEISKQISCQTFASLQRCGSPRHRTNARHMSIQTAITKGCCGYLENLKGLDFLVSVDSKSSYAELG